ncbi:MAG: hypothetical protein OIN86_10605 [Candidatus Methanoperedens sp.]|nr:hypothetical protein [Candidatus Methanoperedens sp.]CAG0963519.1 hypothetical protein METP1_00845 [Methanosarcinales archaeon]
MKEPEHETKKESTVRKVIQSTAAPKGMEQLHAMSTNELVKMLMSPELAKPVDAVLRQQIIKLLQEREGNAFVQRLIGKPGSGKSP